MTSITKYVLPLFAACVLAPGLSASSLFFDDFSDNNANGWYASVSGSLDASSGAMAVTAGRAAQIALTTPSTLVSVGDTITFTFDVSFATSGNADNGFRFGLFDSNGGNLPSANGATGYDNYLGFIATTNPGATGGSPVKFWSRDPANINGALITSIGAFDQVGVNGGSTTGAFPTATFLNATLSYTRTADGLDLSYSLYNGATELQSHSISLTAPSTYTFDVLALSGISTIGAFTLDNVSVDLTTIPEPSTYALVVGAGMLGLVAWRRRRD